MSDQIERPKFKIQLVPGLGRGRFYVVVNGEQIGEVIRVRRYGYGYWKPVGGKHLFRLRRDAVNDLRERREGK